ncbi:integrase [Pseudomonas yamanorum]|nr:integrase [Pseudomonas yamanorum]
MKVDLESVSKFSVGGSLSKTSQPDSALQSDHAPHADFVLCRDAKGIATAIYGEDIWDFNPYRLSANKIGRLIFSRVFASHGHNERLLIEEAKFLIYKIIYFSTGGVIGVLSPSTLNQYWRIIRIAMVFCYEQSRRPLVGCLSLEQLLTVRVYMDSFIKDRILGNNKKTLSAIMVQLVSVGGDRLGYSVLDPKLFDLRRPESNQHPIIPTNIYLNIINESAVMVDQLYQGINEYESFIECFSDEHYGINYGSQKARKLGGIKNYRPDMQQALKDHNLDIVFSREFECLKKRSLQKMLGKILLVIKTVIHLYTGMRDQEVMRIGYSCLSEEVFRPELMDGSGIMRDSAQYFSVLSTTTKFSGYRQQGRWFATAEVVKAISIAQAIYRGLAKLYKISFTDAPLFLNPSILGYKRASSEVTVASISLVDSQISSFQKLGISSDDLMELATSDPSQDFNSRSGFAVGQPWPLTSHQFRRSLAFYGSSSGFLSLPTVRSQFKQLTNEMARYYSNGFDNLKTVFGYYDEVKKDFVLPGNHFAFEFQMAMPMSIANELVSNLLAGSEPLFGGTGSYIEKQKQLASAAKINIQDLRSETERRVREGLVSYRSTLLGGCTKVGRCDDFILGDFVACLSCQDAIIKPNKMLALIQELKVEIELYPEGAGERAVLSKMLEECTAFMTRFIIVKEK